MVRRPARPPSPFRPELAAFPAADGWGLHGWLHAPPRSRAAALWLHGCGGSSVFRSLERGRALAEACAAEGLAFLAFDNRGQELAVRLSGPDGASRLAGTWFEEIGECVADIDGAVAWLRARGYREFHLLGHSTGANKICAYDRRKRRGNPFSKYVLVGGGDDSGLYHARYGGARFRRLLAAARRAVRAGRGEGMADPALAGMPYSWKSLLDILDPDGPYNVFPFGEAAGGTKLSRRKPWFLEFSGIRKPTLVLYGGDDPYCPPGPAAACARLRAHQHPRARMDYAILPGVGHGFAGAYGALGRAIAAWLRRGLAPAREGFKPVR